MRKVPVGVLAQFDRQGDTHPLSITWEDGRVYSIEAVLETRAARNVPGCLRYTVRVHGQTAYLYRTGDCWHMDGAQ